MRYVSPAELDAMRRLADPDLQLGLPGPLQE